MTEDFPTRINGRRDGRLYTLIRYLKNSDISVNDNENNNFSSEDLTRMRLRYSATRVSYKTEFEKLRVAYYLC